MILDLKATLYAEASNLASAQIDPTDTLWAERITTYFDNAHGFPAAGDPSEYSTAFELAYPAPSDRRQYIEKQVLKGKASYGHRVLAALVSAKLVPLLVTTNFDQLLEHASTVADEALPVSDRANLTVATIATSERAERVVADRSWPLLIKLHGDYQDVALKNTAAELQTQDGRLRRSLVSACQSLGLVVIGYSGRDESVMAALAEAIRPGAFPTGLFWAHQHGSRLLPAVEELLARADAAGIATYTVALDTFDDLAGEIARQAQIPAALLSAVEQAAPAPIVVPVKLPTIIAGEFPVLRCSALPILTLPTEARRLTLTQSATSRELRELLRQQNLRQVIVAAQGNSVAAFGRDAEMLDAFAGLGARVDGTVALDPGKDSWAAGLLADALACALVRGRPLRRRLVRRVHTLLAATPATDRTDETARRSRAALAALRSAYGTDLTGTVPTLGYKYAEGISLRLEYRAGKWWCSYEPFTWVDVPRDEAAEGQGDPAGDWRRERWAQRYNHVWFRIIDGWAQLLTGGSTATVRCSNIASTDGAAGEFQILATTGWAKPAGEPTAVAAATR